MDDPRLTPLAASLPASVPFVGPEAQERALGQAFLARLGANESGFGPSPAACAAITAQAEATWMYGDPEFVALRMALAQHHNIAPASIMVGEGIDGLLGYLVRLYVGTGDAVVTSAGAYPTFNYHVSGFGGVVHTVPFLKDHEDPEALISKANKVGAKLIYLANPDNPMGTWHNSARIQAMIDAVPDGALLVLDEAYADLAPPDAIPAFDTTNSRVIRMRTFSKAHGLAAMRVGYAVGAPDVINGFNKVRNHFGVGRLAQAAALAALHDQAYLQTVVAKVAAARKRITRIGQQNGLVALPSAANFVALDCGQDGNFSRQLVRELIARRVFVRMPFVAPQDRCIRVSVGPDAALDIFEAVLPEALQAAHEAIGAFAPPA
jgi:histidinol-phosphate aminotransferase